jgi:predicted nucleic acid-binding protein
VLAFDDSAWRPPMAVLLDTNVAVEALLPNQPEHASCATVMRRLAEAHTSVTFSRLLEVELWEVVFNIALRERHPRKDRGTFATTTASGHAPRAC